MRRLGPRSARRANRRTAIMTASAGVAQAATAAGDPNGTLAILSTAGDGTWTVPAGWNSVKIELIGAGGNACKGDGSGAGTGGGGGQYAILATFAVTPAGSVSYHVGTAGGARGTSALPDVGDSWFSAAATAYAQAGMVGQTFVGTRSGGNAVAVGSCTVNNGGDSPGTNGSQFSAPGGGGSGGPSGVGQSGGAGSTAGGSNGAGGGGSNGGSSTAGAAGGSGARAGGNGNGGTGGGATSGAAGTLGGGGAGGLSLANGGAVPGGNGGVQVVWGASYGPSGGGGGGGNDGSQIGGAGGTYGGGGGGNGYNNTVSTPGAGGQGLIVLTKLS